MMNKRESLYNLGNDYAQTTSAYFVTDNDEAATSAGIAGYKAYSDGLYHFTKEKVYELSGGENALNKRIFNVPQSAWAAPEDLDPSFSAINAASAVLSPDYATGVVVK